jgi:DNA helicase-2/ATP-dependent DNA helicase PcrA
MAKDIDPKKLEIINHVGGPLLVIAGPGAGKTMAIVERVVHLIGTCGVTPESIFVSTFTEKAAKELLTRISRRLLEEDLKVSPNEMYIGTMHSLFLRILKDYSEFTRLKKNYKTFDDFDQSYTVYRRMHQFREIENFGLVAKAQSNWTNAGTLCGYLNKVREEAINPETLLSAPEPEVKALGEAYKLYCEILEGENAIDFSAIQSEMLSLVESHPDVLAEIRSKIKYLIVDEYQDTNTIQERILLELAGPAANICVVGDEDQSIYRFRGASVRNILQFADNFPAGACKTVVLDTNFRSHKDIVSFYNRWMNGCDWKDGKKRFRYDKTISPQPGKAFDDCPGVVRVTGEDVDGWCDNVKAFIDSLVAKKVVTDLNQIAFLFHSVKNKDVVRLVEYLETHGTPVFSPRSAQFFQRDAVRLMIGLLFFLFPQARQLPADMEEHQPETAAYYRTCMQFLADTIKGDAKRHASLLAWAKRKAATHKVLSRATDYTFLTLFYEALKFPMFADYLAVDHDGTPKTSRDAFNLALISQLLSKFEFIYSINVLNPKWLENNLKHLFCQFLHFLYRGGLEEFEDYEEPIPSGCVSVMTIHQSKGLEFPVTVVGSLAKTPRKDWTDLDAILELKYFARLPFEPLERTKYFDFWREYYVAFSRAQNLLVLTGTKPRGKYLLGKEIDPFTEDVADWKAPAFTADNLHLAKIKPPSIKNAYAFTSDILLYENCPLQYMAYRYLGFAPHRQAATMFGSLVHQTIEDVHKSFLRGETFDEERINGWFNLNYASLSLAMKAYLDPNRKNAALEQVKRYVERNRAAFNNILAAEYDVSIPTETFILHGVIDLLRGEGDSVEIVDFKTDKKPDVNNREDMARVANYRRQLEVYSRIVEEKFGRRVSKMHLYYTRTEGESPYVTWDFNPERVEGTLRKFGETVARIESHQFSNAKVVKCARLCDGCDMRFYCNYK